ncbi:hypothetical protein AB3S75_000046, partial [Citrus x aurantiifolia]
TKHGCHVQLAEDEP